MNGAPTTAAGVSDLERVPRFDAEFLAQLRELASPGGDAAAVRELIALFFNTVPAQLEHLESALARGDRVAVSTAAHALKSAAGAVAAGRLAAALMAIEKRAGGDVGELRGFLAVAKAEIAALQEELPRVFGFDRS